MKKITKIEQNRDFKGKKKIQVAAYCRVSTASDEQLVSLENQKVHYEHYIKANGDWDYAGIYFDKGITGTKKDKRDGLLSLIADCECGKVDLVITKSISRFCRNTTDCLELVRKLLDLGVHIIFEKENLNTGSMESELMLSILSSLAESESVSISENEKWSVRKRFQNGTFIISYPPYGYQNEDGAMVIVPDQAEIIREIFASALSGKGTGAIADDLNARAVPAKKDGKWTSATIWGIIRNEKYTGDALFQKTYTDDSFNRHKNYGDQDQYLVQGHHEAIISHEDYEKANAALKQRGREKGISDQTEKYHNRYGFSAKIKCGECGSNYKRRINYKPSGSEIAWCCSRHIENADECSMKYILDDRVKAAFLTMMNKLIFGQKLILKPLFNSLKGQNDDNRLERINELEIKLEKNIEQRQVLTNLMASGYLDPALFNKESNELSRQGELLCDEKENLIRFIGGDMSRTEELKKLIKFVSKSEMLTQYDDELFLSYVERITVLSRKELVFELKCGLKLRERLVK